MKSPSSILNLPTELTCQICKNLLQNPITCSECMNANVCSKCVRVNSLSKCPLCQAAWSDNSLKPNPFFLKYYNESEIACSNEKCSWSGKTPSFLIHQEECGRKVVSCSLEKYGCAWSGLQCEEKQHKKSCPLEPMRKFINYTEKELERVKEELKEKNSIISSQENIIQMLFDSLEASEKQKNMIGKLSDRIEALEKEDFNSKISTFESVFYEKMPRKLKAAILLEKYQGVLFNISLKQLLQEGFQMGMTEPYFFRNISDDFQIFQNKLIVILAARKTDEDNLILAAAGKGKAVFKETSKDVETHLENGVFWYHLTGKSMGFSGIEKVKLNDADVEDHKSKLSWHLNGKGGYRLGELKELNDSKAYEKVLLFFD